MKKNDLLVAFAPLFREEPCVKCGDGWLTVVERYLLDLKAALPPEAKLDSIRFYEKYGTLNVDLVEEYPLSDDARTKLRRAEILLEGRSENICQICGDKGNLRESGSGWMSVSCEQHARDGKKMAPQNARWGIGGGFWVAYDEANDLIVDIQGPVDSRDVF
ncbi:hypothetical protein [Phyllobacterium sp. K27]